MRKGWIALAVTAGAAGLLWGNSLPTQAAMAVGGIKTDMSLVEPAARKRKRSKAVCQQKLLWHCCTEPGKQENCTIKMM